MSLLPLLYSPKSQNPKIQNHKDPLLSSAKPRKKKKKIHQKNTTLITQREIDKKLEKILAASELVYSSHRLSTDTKQKTQNPNTTSPVCTWKSPCEPEKKEEEEGAGPAALEKVEERTCTESSAMAKKLCNNS
jgi:hypothetical protein